MRVLLLTLVFVGSIAGTGFAAPIVYYDFTGTLTGSAPSTESNAALRELTAGDHFTGSFWYTFDTPPPPEGSPTGGIYAPSVLSGFSLAYQFVFDSLTISGGVVPSVVNTAPFVRIGNGTTDTFALSDFSPQSAVGNTLDEFLLSLSFSGDTWADRSMPATLLPSNFIGGSFLMTILPNPCGACYELSGTIDTLESRAVPEPSALLLAGLGLAASFFGSRSSRVRKAFARTIRK